MGFPTPFRSPDLPGELPHEVVSASVLRLAGFWLMFTWNAEGNGLRAEDLGRKGAYEVAY